MYCRVYWSVLFVLERPAGGVSAGGRSERSDSTERRGAWGVVRCIVSVLRVYFRVFQIGCIGKCIGEVFVCIFDCGKLRKYLGVEGSS